MTRKFAILLAVAGAVGVVLFFRPSPGPAPSPVAATRGVPRLVDLGAKSCIPCKAMAPILEQLRTDYAGRMEVEFIDLFVDRAAGEQWDVKVMPTQIFLSADGRELFRHEGFMSREDVLRQWKTLGVEL